MKYNFNKIDTLNQGTPYDYNSVMQYEKYGQPHFYFTDFMHCHVYFTALTCSQCQWGLSDFCVSLFLRQCTSAA